MDPKRYDRIDMALRVFIAVCLLLTLLGIGFQIMQIHGAE